MKPFASYRIFIIPLFLLIAVVIYSCRKDTHTGNIESTTTIADTRAWYEKTYPLKAGSPGKYQDMSTAGETTGGDFSQIIKPDWNKAKVYELHGKQVTEMPLDSAVKLGFANKPLPNAAQGNLDQLYSKSAFIILGNAATGYKAYVMTIMADSAWLAGDLHKLNAQTYRHKAANFSGKLLYFSPQGKLLSGYSYADGKVMGTIKSNKTIVSNKEAQAYITDSKPYKTLGDCTTSFLFVSTRSTCTTTPGYSGIVCVNYYDLYTITSCQDESTSVPAGSGSHNEFVPADGGGNGIDVTVEEVHETQIINVDSLKGKFPCAVKLVVDSLLKIGAYNTFTQPFVNGTNNSIAKLNWNANELLWNSTRKHTYKLGMTTTINNELSADITLNSKMLQNSSQLLIAATAIHETFHAYINYNIQISYYNYKDSTMSLGSWMYGLDSWYSLKGLPSNFTNHYEMLDLYFDQAVSALAAWDNNNHNIQDYRMVMLFGLDNADLPVTPQNQARITLLNNEYQHILTKYNITATALNAYWTSQLNSPVSSRLPTNGCN